MSLLHCTWWFSLFLLDGFLDDFCLHFCVFIFLCLFLFFLLIIFFYDPFILFLKKLFFPCSLPPGSDSAASNGPWLEAISADGCGSLAGAFCSSGRFLGHVCFVFFFPFLLSLIMVSDVESMPFSSDGFSPPVR